MPTALSPSSIPPIPKGISSLHARKIEAKRKRLEEAIRVAEASSKAFHQKGVMSLGQGLVRHLKATPALRHAVAELAAFYAEPGSGIQPANLAEVALLRASIEAIPPTRRAGVIRMLSAEFPHRKKAGA